MPKIKCACTGKDCEGICREKHLYRKRKSLKHCPAAYPSAVVLAAYKASNA